MNDKLVYFLWVFEYLHVNTAELRRDLGSSISKSVSLPRFLPIIEHRIQDGTYNFSSLAIWVFLFQVT
jgi:hypothetical protein